MTTAEKIIMIRNVMVEPIRFNVDISYYEESQDQPENRGTKTGGGWGEAKAEYFTGLTIAQVDQLALLVGVYGIKASIRVHQVGTD